MFEKEAEERAKRKISNFIPQQWGVILIRTEQTYETVEGAPHFYLRSLAKMWKEGAGFDLAMALAVLSAKEDYPRSQDAKVLVIGELELSGKVRAVKGVTAALSTAYNAGITYAIIPSTTEAVSPSKSMKILRVDSLEYAYNTLVRIDEYEVHGGEFESSVEPKEKENGIVFDEPFEQSLDTIEGHNGLKYAMAVAAAGGHHLLAYGAPGCGKTLVLQHMPELMPHLTNEETQSTTRIHSIAGLLGPNDGYMKTRPFRMPHQTATIEGICGGGIRCLPGEITLAHNGVLFLDEAAEFKTSVLQMLRVPLESKTITLSRAGRTTVYPAKFQLVMATNPCPCGFYGSTDRVCLCSGMSVEQYWKKFSGPLIDRIAIRVDCNAEDTCEEMPLKLCREMIKSAWERQYERQGKLNGDLNPLEVGNFIKLTPDAQRIIDDDEKSGKLTIRGAAQIMLLARTIADMRQTEENDILTDNDIKSALALRKPVGFVPDLIDGLH